MSTLANYASLESESLGRRYQESPPPEYRGQYQRDRDRIVHSTAFRRLVYKTQVFVNHEGDLYRTRLTHSLEVAQIGRSIARALQLNETLTEAICLAHDLGHTPFGHAGQDALNECMRPFGGFEHNLQSLRIVDELEECYAEFRGLNLTFETREGILKHCSRANAERLGMIGERFIKRTQPSLEAQIANLADAIAYNNHDVDDGLRAGLVTIADLRNCDLFARHEASVTAAYPQLPERRLIHEIVRRMINELVTDLIEQTKLTLQAANIQTAADVRLADKTLIGFSERMAFEHQQLKQFLRTHVYQHHRVLAMTSKAKRVVQELFTMYLQTPGLLPTDAFALVDTQTFDTPEARQARAVADYIAGMTDRFALKEHNRLFDPNLTSF
jgi:dGTPase